MIMTSSLLLTCLALLGLLTTAAQARPLPSENSVPSKFMMIIMVNNIGKTSTETRELTGNDNCDHMTESSIKGKVTPSPPSPNKAPPKNQGTLDQPIQQRSPPNFQFKSMFNHFGKTPKSPPSPKPAPSKHQGTIEQPIQQTSAPDFKFKSMANYLGKTPKSPSSPKPAPSKHDGTIEEPIRQRALPDFQIASF
ncbi:hypothetical protein REPUB_Repub13aG0029200 [Reevesia pubescens]